MPKENFLEGDCRDEISGEEAIHWMVEALPHKIEVVPYMAQFLLDGKGIPADEARAVRALTTAVKGQYEEEVPRSMCCQQLAKCYAEGRGTVKDRRKAAELYRQTQYSDYYWFDYYKDGVDVPRNPRAAVRYWMLDMCHGCDYLTLWNAVLEPVFSPEGCVRFRPDSLRRLWNGRKRQSGKNGFYDLMRSHAEGHVASDRMDGQHALLYDGARGGDSRCGDILKELLASGAATQEMLEQLSPNRSGVCDWPDVWYEEALERIEGQLAWEVQVIEQSEQLKDLDPEEDLVPADDQARYSFGLLWEDPEDK